MYYQYTCFASRCLRRSPARNVLTRIRSSTRRATITKESTRRAKSNAANRQPPINDIRRPRNHVEARNYSSSRLTTLKGNACLILLTEFVGTKRYTQKITQSIKRAFKYANLIFRYLLKKKKKKNHKIKAGQDSPLFFKLDEICEVV